MKEIKERHDRLTKGIKDLGIKAKATVTLDFDKNKVIHNVEIEGVLGDSLKHGTPGLGKIVTALVDLIEGDGNALVDHTEWNDKTKSIHIGYPLEKH